MKYVAKVKIVTESEEGKIKKTTESYLVKAESVTDVEVLVAKHFEGLNLQWTLSGVSESKIKGIINFKKP